MRASYYFTPRKTAFWLVMTAMICGTAYYGPMALRFHWKTKEGNPKALCVMNQRNLQQAVRSYQFNHNLKSGDPLDWSKLIGPGLFIERIPECPIHGASAYSYSKVIPETGVLAAPCSDPAHKPPGGTSDW